MQSYIFYNHSQYRLKKNLTGGCDYGGNMLDPKVPYLGGFTPKIAEKSQIGLKLVAEKMS